ncbi:MAG: DUF4976 domain-containing protein [Opitutales bacterium]|nr:DUF4976 domain-containing protein [Opitutales bacterium]
MDTPVHLIDILPTLAEVAEVTKQALPTDIDGESIEPILEDQDDTHLKERPLFCHFPRRSTTAGTNGGSFIRKGPYKLIKTWDRKGLAEDNFASYELYHLENDIDESENLVTQKPEVFKKLKVELNEWLSNDELLKPKLNPSYN